MAPGAAVFRYTSVQPLLALMKRSRSPSASRSAKAGLAEMPTSLTPNGLVDGAL